MEEKVWGYRYVNGEIEAKIFTSTIPKGWVDSPAKCKGKGDKNADGK